MFVLEIVLMEFEPLNSGTGEALTCARRACEPGRGVPQSCVNAS